MANPPFRSYPPPQGAPFTQWDQLRLLGNLGQIGQPPPTLGASFPDYRILQQIWRSAAIGQPYLMFPSDTWIQNKKGGYVSGTHPNRIVRA